MACGWCAATFRRPNKLFKISHLFLGFLLHDNKLSARGCPARAGIGPLVRAVVRCLRRLPRASGDRPWPQALSTAGLCSAVMRSCTSFSASARPYKFDHSGRSWPNTSSSRVSMKSSASSRSRIASSIASPGAALGAACWAGQLVAQPRRVHSSSVPAVQPVRSTAPAWACCSAGGVGVAASIASQTKP